MKLAISRTWFLSLCNAVAVGLKIKELKTSNSIRCDLEENETEQKMEIRIVLVGKTGAGKSATGNTILGENAFTSVGSPSSFTRECKKQSGIINGRKISIIDTPGLFDTSLSEEEVEKEIKKCVSYSAPGPHAFLVVIKLERFTKENLKTVQFIERLFGKEALYYTMALFTHGDELEGDIGTFVSRSSELQAFVRRCGGRCFVIDNEKRDLTQVRQLLDNIDEMVSINGGEFYTNEMLQEAERAIEEEKQRILKETEEQRKKEMEDLERLNIAQEELEKRRRQLAKEQEEWARRQAENSNSFLINQLKWIYDVLVQFWFLR